VDTQNFSNITVARVLRPHGRRGEVAAEILTDFPQRLTKLTSAQLWDGRSEPRRVRVLSCWLSQSRGGQAIFHFEKSDSISDAENLVGLEVQIPFSERVTLPSGSYYISDLIGCEVYQKHSASEEGDRGVTHLLDRSALGRVTDVQSTGEAVAGTPILTVSSPKGELFIPLASDICVRIETAASRIEVVLPEGLLDLNQ
jgi:16S rRNA processing protein RimM